MRSEKETEGAESVEQEQCAEPEEVPEENPEGVRDGVEVPSFAYSSPRVLLPKPLLPWPTVPVLLGATCHQAPRDCPDHFPQGSSDLLAFH